MSLEDRKGLWITLAASAALIAVLIWLLFLTEPFTLVILFDDVGELKEGNPVLWRDFNVGKVDEIQPLVDNQIGVTIRINQDYVSRITHGTEFTLQRASFLGLIGQNAIVINTPEVPGSPFRKGEKIQGQSQPEQSLLGNGKRVTLEYWEELKAQTSQLIEDFRNSPYREEASEALDQLGNLAEEGTRQAEEGWEQFRKDHQGDMERILKKLEQVRNEMMEAGDETGARRLKEQINRIKGGVKDEPGQGQSPHRGKK